MPPSTEVAALIRDLDEATRRMFDPLADKREVDLDERIDIVQTDAGLSLAVCPPLVHDLYMGAMENERLNASLALKMAMYEEELRDKKFGTILHTLVQRPYRAEMLFEFWPQMENNDAWEQAGWVWTDSENCYQNLAVWRAIFTDPRPGRENLMLPEEREALAAMPDPIPVWHGVDGSEFAWTTRREVAVWFAKRFGSNKKQPRLRGGMAPKDKVLAYFSRRGEDEILILREDVQDAWEIDLTPGDAGTKPSRGGDANVDLPA